MSDLLKSLMEYNGRLDDIEKRLGSIDNMLISHDDLKKITPKYAGFVYDNSIEIATIFQNENVTVTYGIWHKKYEYYPLHCHYESNEYLIAVAGSFNTEMGGVTTLLKKGDQMLVPTGKPHVVVSLEDESEMFGICIPPEKVYLRPRG
jgi:mannose-6-phosphate isomerase-like protein (cupin superfamily)